MCKYTGTATVFNILALFLQNESEDQVVPEVDTSTHFYRIQTPPT